MDGDWQLLLAVLAVVAVVVVVVVAMWIVAAVAEVVAEQIGKFVAVDCVQTVGIGHWRWFVCYL